VLLGKFSTAVVDAAIATPLIRFQRDLPGGSYTNGAWFGGASVVLALASYGGDTSADARLLQQIRYSIAGGNEPCANGGYPSQHELLVTGMLAIAKVTPRIWNQVTPAEVAKIDLLMKATFVAGAYVTSDTNPSVFAKSQQYTLDGDANMNRDWGPNYREGYIGNVLSGVAYFGEAKATAILEGYQHGTFVSELEAAGLSNASAIFDWKAAHPTSNAPTGAAIAGALKSWKMHGLPLAKREDIYRYLLEDTYDGKVSSGLNGGAGYQGSGKMVSGADLLPNKGSLGMLKELDTIDGGGLRSSAQYAFYGYRPHLTNLFVLLVTGYVTPTSALFADMKSRLAVGNRDLWFKIDKGYRSWAKGHSQGVFDTSFGATWGFTYNRALWTEALAPYLGL
jgi:hypothetical protein